MHLEKEVKAGNIKIGMKQTTKHVELGLVAEVFVAKDAEPRIVQKIVHLCQIHDVKITYVDTMKLLGKSCGIEVGAAMAALLKD